MDTILPYVTFAHNAAVQELAGFTSFRLIRRREAMTTLEAMLSYHPSKTTAMMMTLLGSLNQLKKHANSCASEQSSNSESTPADTTSNAAKSTSTLVTEYNFGRPFAVDN